MAVSVVLSLTSLPRLVLPNTNLHSSNRECCQSGLRRSLLTRRVPAHFATHLSSALTCWRPRTRSVRWWHCQAPTGDAWLRGREGHMASQEMHARQPLTHAHGRTASAFLTHDPHHRLTCHTVIYYQVARCSKRAGGCRVRIQLNGGGSSGGGGCCSKCAANSTPVATAGRSTVATGDASPFHMPPTFFAGVANVHNASNVAASCEAQAARHRQGGDGLQHMLRGLARR